jgi:TonB family protein
MLDLEAGAALENERARDEMAKRAIPLTSPKEQIEANNRRLCPRGTLRGGVLVFFGLGKWGRLIDISEGGMAFEFYELPPSGKRLRFGLEVMEREPPEASSKLAIDSIHADGQVVWTRDFDRCAGVQFVDISGATRQQIRQWLSIEPSSGAATEGEKVQGDPIETELPGRPLTLNATKSEGIDEGQPWNADLAQCSSPQALSRPEFDEQPTIGERSGAKSNIDRAALMSIAPWLAVFAMLAGITTMILSERVHLAKLFESIRERSISNRAPPPVGERSVVKPPLVYQVEAVDANNRRMLLTFDNNASSVEAWLSSDTAASSTTNKAFLVSAAAPPSERTAAEKRRSLSNLKLGRPTVTRRSTSASTENSTLAIDSVALSREVIGAGYTSGPILANTKEQVPAAPQPIHVSGQAQQARLISSVSPAYPALAKSIGLQGDITIDALIDATGRVTTMKPLSGPVALQQAAMDALRQWNYEPARLDGQPVSTHVSVTMKFRLD